MHKLPIALLQRCPQGSNNLCISVEAVPHYKIFNFGGQAGTMGFLNELTVMDCGSRFWAAPEVLGAPPCARWVQAAAAECGAGRAGVVR